MFYDLAKWFSTLVGPDVAFLVVTIPIVGMAIFGWGVVFRSFFFGGRMCRWTPYEEYEKQQRELKRRYGTTR